MLNSISALRRISASIASEDIPLSIFVKSRAGRELRAGDVGTAVVTVVVIVVVTVVAALVMRLV